MIECRFGRRIGTLQSELQGLFHDGVLGLLDGSLLVGGQNAFVGEVVPLHGTAIDTNGDGIVSWNWSIDSMPSGSTSSLSDPNIQSPTFTPYLEGRYIISLVVSDGKNESIPDTVVIQVSAKEIPVTLPGETERKFP